MSLDLEIYTPDRRNRHSITHAVASNYTRHYNAIGKISLALVADDYNMQIIKQGSMILEKGSGETYVLVNPHYDQPKNLITANGYTSNWLLNKRAIAQKNDVKNVAAGVYQTVRTNLRGLPVQVASAAPLEADPTDAVLYGGQLLDGIIPVLEAAEMGHRMVWDDDTRELTFQLYKGADRTKGIHAIVFSEVQGTAKNLISDQDDSILKNYFYCPVEYKDGTTAIVEYGAQDAPDRRELWIRTALRQDNGETPEQLNQRARWKCQEEAEKRVSRQNFSVSISPDELGGTYDLGDKIVCASERLGLSFTARITGVTYKQDINGEKAELLLGEPTLTVIDEVMLK